MKTWNRIALLDWWIDIPGFRDEPAIPQSNKRYLNWVLEALFQEQRQANNACRPWTDQEMICNKVTMFNCLSTLLLPSTSFAWRCTYRLVHIWHFSKFLNEKWAFQVLSQSQALFSIILTDGYSYDGMFLGFFEGWEYQWIFFFPFFLMLLSLDNNMRFCA